MASSQDRLTRHPAFHFDTGYVVSGFVPPGPEDMARTDSGYRSDMSGRAGYYGDPRSVLQEEPAECQYEDSTVVWQFQHGMGGVEAAYDQQQPSDYTVQGAGSHMTGYYPAVPRTTMSFEAAQDMGLDHDEWPYLEPEDMSWWPGYVDSPTTSHEAYPDHVSLSTMVPTVHDDGAPTTYFDLCTAQAVGSPPTANHRDRVPSAKASITSDSQPPRLASATTITTTTTSSSSSSSSTNKFLCLMPSCNKQFNRPADLDRHMKFIHRKDAIPAMACDYRRCARHKNPFHRPDHFRNHLRDQHKEDLLKRNEAAPAPEDPWWRDRAAAAVYGEYWRCTKCFARVPLDGGRDDDGTGSMWKCAGCGNYCEAERQTVRELPRECNYTECSKRKCGHRECVGEGRGSWRSLAGFREHLRVCHGEDVPVREGREGEKELASEQWWATRSPDAIASPLWRCTRCLRAVDSTTAGFVCGACGFACEEARKRLHGGV